MTRYQYQDHFNNEYEASLAAEELEEAGYWTSQISFEWGIGWTFCAYVIASTLHRISSPEDVAKLLYPKT